MRILAVTLASLFIALPAWAGIEMACKRIESPILPATLCVMSDAQWKLLSTAEQLKCPEYEIYSCYSHESVRARARPPRTPGPAPARA